VARSTVLKVMFFIPLFHPTFHYIMGIDGIDRLIMLRLHAMRLASLSHCTT